MWDSMKLRNITICALMIFLSFFIINNTVKAGDFDAWVGAPALFTIGKTELVNIYVRNKGNTDDSYNVTNYSKSATRNPFQDVSHLVIVSIPSYKIKTLKANETGDTFAKIILLGPIDSGSVTFNITNSTGGYQLVTISLATGSPIALSEFDFSGIIQILILTFFILVVSYTSHVS